MTTFRNCTLSSVTLRRGSRLISTVKSPVGVGGGDSTRKDTTGHA